MQGLTTQDGRCLKDGCQLPKICVMLRYVYTYMHMPIKYLISDDMSFDM
jgi:hypothetical protein